MLHILKNMKWEIEERCSIFDKLCLKFCWQAYSCIPRRAQQNEKSVYGIMLMHSTVYGNEVTFPLQHLDTYLVCVCVLNTYGKLVWIVSDLDLFWQCVEFRHLVLEPFVYRLSLTALAGRIHQKWTLIHSILQLIMCTLVLQVSNIDFFFWNITQCCVVVSHWCFIFLFKILTVQ